MLCASAVEMTGTEGETQEGEAVVPGEAEESAVIPDPPSAPSGVDMDILQYWMTGLMVRMEDMATREESKDMATQQTENIKAAMKGEMEAMEKRVNAYTKEACIHVKKEIKEEVKEEVEEKLLEAQCTWQHRQEAVMRNVQACFTRVATLESAVASLAPKVKSVPKAATPPALGDWIVGGESVLSPPDLPPGSPSPPKHNEQGSSPPKTSASSKHNLDGEETRRVRWEGALECLPGTIRAGGIPAGLAGC